MKYFSTLVAVVSIILVLFVYFKSDKEINLLHDKVENLDQKIDSLSDSLEVRIANLRSQMSQSAQVNPELQATAVIQSLVSSLSSGRTQVRGEELIDLAARDLQLTNYETDSFKTIISDFNAFKRQLMTRSGDSGPGFLDPKNIQAVREESREVHNRLRELLSPQQYQLLRELEYDIRLGLGQGNDSE